MSDIFVSLVIVSLIVFAFCFQGYLSKKERDKLLKLIIEKDMDMLDRLMSKNLSEIKNLQNTSTSRITTKRKNEERIMKAAKN